MSVRTISNFILFQLGWLIAVIGAARGYPWAGVVYAVAWATLHHWTLSDDRRQELIFVLTSAGFGFVADSLLVLNGFIVFPEEARIGYPSTLWMVSLWLMFAMTLRHSLGWLRDQFVLAGGLGALFGPLAYWAGSNVGALQLKEGVVTIAAIAVVWTVSMICLLSIETLTRGAPVETGVSNESLH